MIAHIVLLQPRTDLTEQQRDAALATLRRAAADVPEIRRVQLGRRVKHGLPGYERAMRDDFEFALIIEVDDLDEAMNRIHAAGIAIEYGPVTEEWGVRRFYVRDPFGKLLNILSHTEPLVLPKRTN